MNKLIWCLFFVGLIAASTALAQEVMPRGRYSLKKTKQTKTLVANIDVDVVMTNHFAKYEVQRKTEDKSGQKEMVLYDKESQKKVELRIVLYPSTADAENGLLDLLNGASVIFKDGTPSGGDIGDNTWYFTTKETGATGIMFVRRNVVVSLFAQEGLVAEGLARKLDADILMGNNGIELKDRQ